MTQHPRVPEPLQLGMPAQPADVLLPVLRADIRLLQAPRHASGNPTWTLHDPVRARFCRIGRLEFELLTRWSLGNAQALITAVNQETTLHAEQHHVDALLHMLNDNELVVCNDKEATAALLTHSMKKQRSIAERFFMLSLFARKKLINPEKLLNKIDRGLSPAYRHPSAVLLLLVTVTLLGLWGLMQHRFELHSTLVDYLSPQGFAGFIGTLVLLNIIHEIGHGLAARRQGCRTTDMGVAFIFMIPIAYCDTSDAWRLDSNRKRLWIDAGGLMIEALVALIAVWGWLLLPDGLPRTLAFFVAVTSLTTTLFINLNPFMKFDGYFLLADALGMENLQERAFATLRWRLRQWTLGSRESMPFPMSEQHCKTVQLYAAGTWIYRFFLYLGIAWLVYQFWFKAFGIFMMLAVFGFMVLKPVFTELCHMHRVVKVQGIHRRTVIAAGITTVLLIIVAAPLPRLITAPAVLTSASTTQLFTPRSARLASIHVDLQQAVTKGDIVAVLESPKLQHELTTQQRSLALLLAQQRQQASLPDMNPEQWIDQQDINQARAAISEIQYRIDALVLRSQSTGHVVRLDNWMQPGTWLPANTIVAEIADRDSTIVRAYIPEHDVRRIQTAAIRAAPTFFPRKHGNALSLAITSMSQDNIDALRDPSLTVANGGSIPAQPLNQDQWTPLQGWHAATLQPTTKVSINREQTGWVRFEAAPVSLASRGFDRLYGALLRELSF